MPAPQGRATFPICEALGALMNQLAAPQNAELGPGIAAGRQIALLDMDGNPREAIRIDSETGGRHGHYKQTFRAGKEKGAAEAAPKSKVKVL